MYSLYSAGDKEKSGRGPIPLQEMLIRLFQHAPFKMYCYGPINWTPRGDIPQINDYLRISHAAVPKAYGWLCRKDYCNTDEYRWLKQPGQGPVLPLQLGIKLQASGLSACIWHLLGTPTTLQLVIMKERKSFTKRKIDKAKKVFGFLKRSWSKHLKFFPLQLAVSEGQWKDKNFLKHFQKQNSQRYPGSSWRSLSTRPSGCTQTPLQRAILRESWSWGVCVLLQNQSCTPSKKNCPLQVHNSYFSLDGVKRSPDFTKGFKSTPLSVTLIIAAFSIVKPNSFLGCSRCPLIALLFFLLLI